jgi:hypothetical protein
MNTATLDRPTTHSPQHTVDTGRLAAWTVFAAGVSSVFSFAVGYYVLHFLAETLALGLQ